MKQKEIINKECYTDNVDFANPKIMDAVKTIIEEIGDDPTREGLKRTPKRVARAYQELFGGYGKKPEDVLDRTFPSEGYDDLCVIKNISFVSHCEHHIVTFKGKVHIAIVYDDRITGLDKFVKLVDIYAKRLQTQEVMTRQIGEAIKNVLKPKGIYVLVEAKHDCVSNRETRNTTTEFVTTYRYGFFEKDPSFEARFFQMVK